jgi:flagellar motor protein MotB
MEDQSSSEHLSSSLTDLMTSLMVIFILLLLVFISHTASKDAALRDVLLKRLKTDLEPQGLSELIRPDMKDRNAILVIVPDQLMRFKSEESTVQPGGRDWLKAHMPAFAKVLCDPDFKSSIDSIVVEGHTDTQPWRGLSREDSLNQNLKLSQGRSMAVVEETLGDLAPVPEQHDCFLEKLSATGRGEQDAVQPDGIGPDASEKADEQSRRVIFKIRVRAGEKDNIEAKVAK